MSAGILQAAEKFCEENGLRFTDTRIDVLRIISASKKPITAYEILEKLGKTIKNPKPPIVYRATDFWQSHGFVHKIESLNNLCSDDTDSHKNAGMLHNFPSHSAQCFCGHAQVGGKVFKRNTINPLRCIVEKIDITIFR